MTKYQTKLSIVSGLRPNILKQTTLIELLTEITKDPELIQEGRKFRKLYQKDKAKYKKAKETLGGFVIGDFSYRDEKSCVEYSPTIGFDIDAIIKQTDYDAAFEKLKTWNKTYLILPSVSGLGIRLMIRTKAKKEDHKNYYSLICSDLSKITGIKLKSKIREGLAIAEYTPDQIKTVLDRTPHIDDQTSDISRFWFYSGLDRSEIYMNATSDFYEIQKAKPKTESSGKPGSYKYEFSQEERIDYLVGKIEASGIDVTAGLKQWFKMGCAIHNEFGDAGEEYFHRISRNHPDFDQKRNEREWRRCISKENGSTKIGSFYHSCLDLGIGIDYAELTDSLRHKFPDNSGITIQNNSEGVPVSADILEKAKIPEPENLSNHNLEAEKSIIAECLRRKEAYEDIFEYCEKFSFECFTKHDHKDVFQAIQRVSSSGMDISPVSVFERLKSINTKITYDQLLEMGIIQNYTDQIVTNVNIVFGNFIKNHLFTLSDQIVSDLTSQEQDIFDYTDDLADELSGISDFGSSRSEKSVNQIMKAVNDYQKIRIENFKSGKVSSVIGIPTGFRELDDRTLGYQKTHLILRAARPGMGKTASALATAKNAAKLGFSVGFFSLEMSSEQLVERMIAMEAEIDLKRIKLGSLDADELERYYSACDLIASLPIYFDDRAGSTVSYIARVARKWKREKGLDLIIIDYLGLISPPDRYKGNKTNEIGEISKDLKGLAKTMKIPILALHQLSRAVETRGGLKRPILSDLRDSGTLEQDADIVEFVYRPEYYDILEDGEGVSLVGTAFFIVAKCRDGKPGDAETRFIGKFVKFCDADDLPDGWNFDDPDHEPKPKMKVVKSPNKTQTLEDKMEKIRSKILTADDLEAMNQEEIKNRKTPLPGDVEFPEFKEDTNIIRRSKEISDDDIPF